MYNNSFAVSTQPSRNIIRGATAVAFIGCLLGSGTGSSFTDSNVEAWRNHVQHKLPYLVDDSSTYIAADHDSEYSKIDVRDPSTMLQHIRSVLSPPMSELASFFGVSRQAIYKWISGESYPDEDKLFKIRELAVIADIFTEENISRPYDLLRMKAFAGRSLFDILISGEEHRSKLAVLIAESKAMEKSYAASSISESKTPVSDNWLSSISIPGQVVDQ